jgi:hypothetical protein
VKRLPDDGGDEKPKNHGEVAVAPMGEELERGRPRPRVGLLNIRKVAPRILTQSSFDKMKTGLVSFRVIRYISWALRSHFLFSPPPQDSVNPDGALNQAAGAAQVDGSGMR